MVNNRKTLSELGHRTMYDSINLHAMERLRKILREAQIRTEIGPGCRQSATNQREGLSVRDDSKNEPIRRWRDRQGNTEGENTREQ